MSNAVAAADGLRTAEALKAEGNAAFGKGNVEECLARYHAGVDALALAGAGEEATALRATLLSNMANALLSAKRWHEAAAAATKAVKELATIPAAAGSAALMAKARYRRASALHAGGRSFEALIDLLQIDCRHEPMAGMKREVARAVGLGDLDEAFGVAPSVGGFTAVALDDVPAGHVFFAEAQLVVGVDAAEGEDSASATTESRVRAFTQSLLEMRRSEDPKDQESFRRVGLEMAGSWPRQETDLPAEVRVSVRGAINDLFTAEERAAETEDGMAVSDAVALTALQCRYNCFHRGFFRTCALLNHSCDANAAMKYSPGRSLSLHAQLPDDANSTCIGVVSLVTCRKIRKGEQVTVKYLGDFDFILGVLPRRDLLRASWLFVCDCRRCKSDLEPTAQTEWMRCTAETSAAGEGCGGIVHLPVPPDTDTAVAHSLDDLERLCPQCGKKAAVSEELKRELHDVRLRTLNLVTDFQRPGFLLKDLHDAAVAQRERVARHCHEAHWLHALVVYQFCVLAQRRVEEVFAVALDGRLGYAAASAQLGLENYVAWPAGAKEMARPFRPDLDVLGWHVELERRLIPYYPEAQLWSLHVAIGRLAVLLALAHPTRLADVEDLIVRKAPQFSRTISTAALAALSKVFTSKQLRVVGKALK
jgi:hypothetical protein